MRKRKGKRPNPEYSVRSVDGKTLRWEWFYETELGIYPRSWSRRFPHLASRGRWVVTSIKNPVQNKKTT